MRSYKISLCIFIIFALTFPSFAAQRKGTITIIKLTLPDRATIDALTNEGFNIASVDKDTATIYATSEEVSVLNKKGYDYTIIGTQDPTKTIIRDPDDYHTYSTLTTDLQNFADTYPEICRLSSAGKSVQNRELWVLLITNNPDIEEDEPEFKYISSMHGDEVVGMELCMIFAEMLLTEYGTNPRITQLIDTTFISIMPCMNPDGLELGTRYNANGYDLNRSFPIYPDDYSLTIYDNVPLGDIGRQPEVANVMRWTAQNSFTLSANFHGGALVANYPYDDDGLGSTFSPTPDNDLFVDICLRYSMNNIPMYESTSFEDGITNGADWYMVKGGMQDWFYRFQSCNDVTLEVSLNDRPSYSKIPDYWDDNRESMLTYLEAVHIGVRGIITDRATGQPLFGRVWVEGNTHPVFTDPDIGDYHRMLLPGTYNLIFQAPGYASQRIDNVAVTDFPATRIDIQLSDIDLDDSGSVDITDLSILTAHWLDTDCGQCVGADLTGDNKVNIEDFTIFGQNYPPYNMP